MPLLRVEGVGGRSGASPGQREKPTLFPRQSQAWWEEPAKAGLVGPRTWCQELFLPCSPSLHPPPAQWYLPASLHEVFLKQDLGLEAAIAALGFLRQVVEPGVGEALSSTHAGPVGRGQRGEAGWCAHRPWSPASLPTSSHPACTRIHWARTVGFVSRGEPHPWSLTMRWETKSLASSDTASKVSSSKYQLAARTLFRVSVSSSPRKGERPLSLEGGDHRGQRGEIRDATSPWRVWGMGIDPRRQHQMHHIHVTSRCPGPGPESVPHS